ncbi:hypothetical protein CNEO4_640002 [Clostridium neonatale]|nr:hypothetical protein CNEO4_640002 [Clostridium neonatale]
MFDNKITSGFSNSIVYFNTSVKVSQSVEQFTNVTGMPSAATSSADFLLPTAIACPLAFNAFTALTNLILLPTAFSPSVSMNTNAFIIFISSLN